MRLTGKISALISIWLQNKTARQSMFFVPRTTGRSFLRYLSTVTWSGYLSLSSIYASNLASSLSPMNSNMKVSSKTGSVEHRICYVLYLFLRKLTVTERYSSCLTLTKSTKALPFTMLQLRYFLLGSKSFFSICFLWLGAMNDTPLF